MECYSSSLAMRGASITTHYVLTQTAYHYCCFAFARRTYDLVKKLQNMHVRGMRNAIPSRRIATCSGPLRQETGAKMGLHLKRRPLEC